MGGFGLLDPKTANTILGGLYANQNPIFTEIQNHI